MICRGFRFRLYPNQAQQRALAVQFGHARFVYNWGLAMRKAYYAEHGKGLSYYALKRQLTELKQRDEFAWLNEADSQVLQAKIKDLDRAYRHFFAKRARYPRFKSRKHDQKIRYPQRFKLDGYRIFLPKVGWMKAVFHRALDGTPKQVTVTKTKSGTYFGSIQCAMTNDPRPYGTGEIGIDVGLTHFAVLSTGEKLEHPQYLRQSERRLKRLQRELTRKQPGSANREKARLKLARAAAHVANQRQDFLDKLSHDLAAEYHTIKIENLNVCGMLRNHKLAKSISDSGWGLFGRMLDYKAAVCQRIDRFYPSSKTCAVCGSITPALQLQHRFWTCPVCHTEHDRDVNAAINLVQQPTAGAAGRHTPVESVSDGPGLCATRNAPRSRKP
jgi:putative transposase